MTLTELMKKSKEAKKATITIFGNTLLGAAMTAIGLYKFTKGMLYTGGIFGALSLNNFLEEELNEDNHEKILKQETIRLQNKALRGFYFLRR